MPRLLFFVFLLLSFFMLRPSSALAVNCSQPTTIGSSVTFSPVTPVINQSVKASVTANNATEVDAAIHEGDKNGNVIAGKNGGICGGTTCSLSFTPAASGTYTACFNAWNDCSGTPQNHVACTAVTVSSSGTITPSTTPTSTTTGSVSVRFEGIDSLNNTKPKHLQRKLTLYFYTDSTYGSDPTGTKAKAVATDTLTYSGGSSDNSNPLFGTFTNTEFKLGNVPTGDYYILAKSQEGSLRQLLSASKIRITSSKSNTIVSTDTTSGTPTIPQLQMGDINNDNTIDINDYANLRDCYGNFTTQSRCTNHNLTDTTKGIFADLNDDGVVDGIDYNLMIRNMNSNGL